jgi:hypothetical protein
MDPIMLFSSGISEIGKIMFQNVKTVDVVQDIFLVIIRPNVWQS